MDNSCFLPCGVLNNSHFRSEEPKSRLDPGTKLDTSVKNEEGNSLLSTRMQRFNF